jgi:hypothetical protein
MKHECRLLTVTFGDTNAIKLRAVPHVHVLKSHFSSIQDHCERLPDTVRLMSFPGVMFFGPLVIKHHIVLL